MRQIPSEGGRLTAAVEGDIAAVDRVLRITEIRVRYALKIPAGTRAAAERALATPREQVPRREQRARCIKIAITADIVED